MTVFTSLSFLTVVGFLAITVTGTLLHRANQSVDVNPQRYLIKTESPQFLKIFLWLAGIEVRGEHNTSGDSISASLSSPYSVTSVVKLFSVAKRFSLVEYAVLDSLFKPSSVGVSTDSDKFIDLQWQLGESANELAAINVRKAWEQTEGSYSTVIAVIDSGVRFGHPDLVGRLLPGYDFVSDPMRSKDGDGRDFDASDPGDGVSDELADYFNSTGVDCESRRSSWHGTAVSSLIAGNGLVTNGLSGVDRKAMVLPIRAIGQCGGRRSDFLDAIRWAAGVTDSELPPNPTPARIINISMHVAGNCTIADQQAINDAVAAGAIIVASAGNASRDLAQFPSTPATCRDVVGVAAVNSNAEKASYSSFGVSVDLSAPGGENLNGEGRQILAASNAGQQDAVLGSYYRRYSGTSFATPLVSGVLGLMLGANSSLTNNELYALLTSSTRRFPDYVNGMGNADCTTSTCGSGLLDAAAAVVASVNYQPVADDRYSGKEDGFFESRAIESPNAGALEELSVSLLLCLCYFRLISASGQQKLQQIFAKSP